VVPPLICQIHPSTTEVRPKSLLRKREHAGARSTVRPPAGARDPQSASRTFLGRFTLDDGTRGNLLMQAVSSCDVLDFVMLSFPHLHSCSARCEQ